MKGIMFNNHYGLESAVLEGRKTQTRRIDKRSLCLDDAVRCGHKYFRVRGKFLECHTAEDFSDCFIQFRMPYEIGEVVAIKQKYYNIWHNNKVEVELGLFEPWRHIDDYDILFNSAGWENKMFVKNDLMPHQIKVTNIRVERLQDIREADCLAEGVEKLDWRDGYKHYCPTWRFDKELLKEGAPYCATAKASFSTLIDKISGKGTWESNPYVWVIEFEKLKGGSK